MQHVILGNGPAGISAARKIRSLNPDDEIIIVSDEPYKAYSRCFLANYIEGAFDEDRLRFVPEDFYEKNKITLLLGERVVATRFDQKEVVLESGKTLTYDKLLIATGSKPAYPPIPGLDNEKLTPLRTLDDAKKIAARAKSGTRWAVIGGGFIGLEAAHALNARGARATVLEMMPHVLPTSMDEIGASIIQSDLEKEGISFLVGNDGRVEEIKDDGSIISIKTASVKDLEVDFGIVALGVNARVEFLDEEKIEVEPVCGVVVNEHLETSVKDVYAAGDVCRTMDLLYCDYRMVPIWPNAVAQGKVAGSNMAGHPVEYRGEVAMQNSMEFRIVPAIAFGITKPELPGDEVKSYLDRGKSIYKKVVFREDVPVGFILVGDISHAGILSSLVKAGTAVPGLKDKVLDPTFSLAYLPHHEKPFAINPYT